MNSVIEVDKLVKTFGGVPALSDVSFEVEPGTVFALLGENGAGKTTAIKIMLGLANPDMGRTRVLGLDSHRDGIAIRRRVGYVSERPTLYEWMRVGEIGWFTAAFYGGTFLQRYIELINGFELAPAQKIKNLSKGTRAKVCLALALAHDPDLLILDEPTSGLDPLVRRDFLQSMVDRAATGKTVFLSSHQINEVERVADVVGILRQGKLVLVEPIERLKDETVEVTLTLADGVGQPPQMPGQTLSEVRKDRQWRVHLRHAPKEELAKLEERPEIVEAVVRTPTLEEIFVAVMS